MDHRHRTGAASRDLRGVAALTHRGGAAPGRRRAGAIAGAAASVRCRIDQGGDNDHELARAARAGDQLALDTLLRRHYDRLFALCRRLTGNADDAADAAQDALIAIARGIAAGRFDGTSQFSTWAWRVTTNACLDELRRRRRRPDATTDDELDLMRRPVGMAETGAVVAERLDVDAALRRLPPDFRAAVVLRDLCGLDYAEIAEVLSIPPGTVRSRIARGRAALAPLLRNPATPPGRPTPRQ